MIRLPHREKQMARTKTSKVQETKPVQTRAEKRDAAKSLIKELLAKKGEELFNLSEKHNCVVLYEAAIAGGIPLIMPIKT